MWSWFMQDPYKAHRLISYADSLALDFDGAYVFTQKRNCGKPIVIKAAGDGGVIFDGDGSYRPFDVMAADYHYFDYGLTIRNTDNAFYAGLKHVKGCSGLTKNCKMIDIGIGVVTFNEDSKDFYRRQYYNLAGIQKIPWLVGLASRYLKCWLHTLRSKYMADLM